MSKITYLEATDPSWTQKTKALLNTIYNRCYVTYGTKDNLIKLFGVWEDPIGCSIRLFADEAEKKELLTTGSGITQATHDTKENNLVVDIEVFEL